MDELGIIHPYELVMNARNAMLNYKMYIASPLETL